MLWRHFQTHCLLASQFWTRINLESNLIAPPVQQRADVPQGSEECRPQRTPPYVTLDVNESYNITIVGGN